MKTIEIDIDVNRAIEMGRLEFGESPNAILRRLLAIDGRPASQTPQPKARLARSSGAYSVHLGNTTVEANTLKDLLRRVILVAENQRPGTIERLAEIITAKGRRIVARDAALLYPRSPHLVEFAERLGSDWWVDGNIGRNQTTTYLKTVARLLSLPHLPVLSKRSEKSPLTDADFGIA